MLHSLHIATFNNDLHTVNIALSNGVDINLSDENKTTALHIASEMGYCDLITMLVYYGAKLSAINSAGMSPLHLAAAFGHADAVKTLFELGANIEILNAEGATPLHTALTFRHNFIAKQLIGMGAKQKSINFSKQSALHLAIINNDLEMVKWLIDKGADLETADCQKMLPLHTAILYERTMIAQCLIETQTKLRSVLILKKKRLFPFEFAAMKGATEIMHSLVKKNAGQFHQGSTVKFIKQESISSTHFYLMLAFWGIKHDYINLVFSLVSKHLINLRTPNKHGDTLLHLAAKYDYESLVEFLLNHDLSIINQTNCHGETPFEIAINSGNWSVATLLARAVYAYNDEKYITPNLENYEKPVSYLYETKKIQSSSTKVDVDSQQTDRLKLSR
jgi:ankyrin repeat protein